MPTRAAAAKPRTSPKGGVLAQFRAWRMLKVQVTKLTKDQNDLRDNLKALVETQGYEDDKGHIWFDLPEEVDGYVALKSEKRVAQYLNEDKAEEILKRKGLWDACTVTVVEIDAEEVQKQFYQGGLTKKDLDVIFTQQITYAFVPAKKK